MIKTMAAYDAAKAALEVEKNMVVQSTYAIANLINDMLQYRRENNIFEVGDKVVFIHPFELGDLFTVHSTCERFIGVKRNNDESIYYAETAWGLKHANDKEIQAQRRL